MYHEPEDRKIGCPDGKYDCEVLHIVRVCKQDGEAWPCRDSRLERYREALTTISMMNNDCIQAATIAAEALEEA